MSATITNLQTMRRVRVPAAAPVVSGRRVADFLKSAIARVPGWFTVAQARRVAELKGVDHLLVDDKQGLTGTAALSTLAVAPPTDLVARWATRSATTVAPTLSIEEAEQQLRAGGSACLPVVSGGMLIGTISLNDLVMADEDISSHAA